MTADAVANRPSNLIAEVQAAREEAGLSLRALAEITGISFSTISRLEKGEHVPDEWTATRLLQWLENGPRVDQRRRGHKTKPSHWMSRIEQRLVRIERAVGIGPIGGEGDGL
jgi:transcriptional regulator with XRE-family HTH domain